MSFADRYLLKQDHHYSQSAEYLAIVPDLIVVIPCYDEPNLGETILSLFNCDDPDHKVLLLIVINDAEKDPPNRIKQNLGSMAELALYTKSSPLWIELHWIYATNLPSKHAGAGWARKIGMDWAVSVFNQTGNSDGIIVSLDADTTVASNYFAAIAAHYKYHLDDIGTTLYFEHPIPDDVQGEAITMYELYMRYYKNAIQLTGFPHSIYTVGSCFTVKAGAYVAQGGMNRKKAGEDFYFLHKLSQLGSIGEMNNTVVSPSSRLSNRVPFGTGPALQKYFEGSQKLKFTYSLDAIFFLKPFFDKVDQLFSIDTIVPSTLSDNSVFQQFITSTNFIDELNELKSNCSSVRVFRKRFFHLFNAFKIIKWLNYSTTNGYPKVDLIIESQKLIQMIEPGNEITDINPKRLLNFFRNSDKTANFHTFAS